MKRWAEPALQVVLLTGWLCIYAGCRSQPKEPPIWEKVKIGDLASSEKPDASSTNRAPTVNLEITLHEIPAGNLALLHELWKPLTKKGLRFKNHHSFQSNGYRIARGQIRNFGWIATQLQEANAQKIQNVSLLLSDGKENDVPIRPIPATQKLTFTAMNSSTQTISLTPGVLSLRFHVNRNPANPFVTEMVAYPFLKVPTSEVVETLARKIQARQISFMCAAFTTHLTPGDVIVLGPQDYYGDGSTLGGLFFGNPSGRLFTPLNNKETPKLEPSVRILVILCTNVS
jgi:hypothetical protein